MLFRLLRRIAFRHADQLGESVQAIDLDAEFPVVMDFMRLRGQRVRAFRCSPKFLSLVRTALTPKSGVLVACFIQRHRESDLFFTPALTERVLPRHEQYAILLSNRMGEELECDLVHELTHFDQFRSARPQDELAAQANEILFLRDMKGCQSFNEAVCTIRGQDELTDELKEALKRVWDTR